MNRSFLRCLLVFCSFSLLTAQASAVAPARYQAMGATIAYINDATALRFNPAGLGHLEAASFSVGFSPIFGGLHAPIISNVNTPRDEIADRQLDSEPIFGPGFMLSGGARVTDWLTLGLSIYPVIAGGADYRYVEDPEGEGAEIQDYTKKLHAEIAPGIAFNVPSELIGGQHLSLGVAYRIGYGQLTRLKGDPADPKTVNLNATGLNLEGFSVGLQYEPIPELQIGLTYRHGVTIDLKGDEATLTAGVPFVGPVTSDIVSPSMVGLGLRGNVGKLSLAVDVEYEMHSEVVETINKIETGVGFATPDGFMPLVAGFHYQDAINIRTGLEVRIDETWAVMGGYTLLGQSGNRQYPTAFGAPPADNHIGAVGARYDAGDWEMNAAYTYRTAEATIVSEDLVGQGNCNTCTPEGLHTLTLHGVHVDFSMDF